MDQLRSDLQEVLQEVFGDDTIELKDGMTADEIEGWDSLMHINVMIAVEKRFKIKLATAEISGLKASGQNMGTFLRLVAGKLGREYKASS